VPKVSVVIPCYNQGAFLEEAVASVLRQTFSDVEIIVVDDGSTDPVTCALLADYRRPRTRVIRTDNRGVSAARNRGIREAAGEYILPLDADDRIGERYLEQAVAVLDRQPAVGIVYCGVELFGEASGEWHLPEFSLPHQLLDNLIFSAALFRRVDWQRAGGYDEGMRDGWEDWGYWLRLLALGKGVCRLPEILFFYRIRRDSRDRSLGLLRKLRLMLRLVVRHRGLYLRHALAVAGILLGGTRRRPASIKAGS
jgi:glycosyltransferase involved in cell wall biosynthesis